MMPQAMDYTIPDGIYGARRRLRTARHRLSGVPHVNEKRLVANEVLVEIAKPLSPQAIEKLQSRHRLTPLQSQKLQLTGTTMFLWRIADKRTVAAVVRELEADANVASAQPNYIFTFQQDQNSKDAKQQRAFAEMRSRQSASPDGGPKISEAATDQPAAGSQAPDITGSIADASAGLVVRGGRLMIEPPAAPTPADQTSDQGASPATSRTFDILKALELAATSRTRVVNVGFTGPVDPALNRSFEAARKRDMGLAASDDAGLKPAPLGPAEIP